MPKQKAIIFDIDGTVIDSPTQKLPSQRLIKAMDRVSESYYLCAATGRVWSFAQSILSALNLTDPCIIAAGTQICDPATGQILWQSDILPEDLKATLKILKKYPDYQILYNDYNEDDYLGEKGSLPRDLKLEPPVHFLEQIFVPEKIAPEIVEEFSHIEGLACTLVVAQRPGYKDLHITNRNATKEHTVAELLKLINVDREQTTAVGDGHNDIHLFNAVEQKVAMANSVPELKEAADLVIGHVEEDGLAEFLEGLS